MVAAQCTVVGGGWKPEEEESKQKRKEGAVDGKVGHKGRT